MQSQFNELADHITSKLSSGETFTAYLIGEETDFARLNQSKIRQPGHVRQGTVSLRLIQGQKHVTKKVSFTGKKESDYPVFERALADLREAIAYVPEDPYLQLPSEIQNSERIDPCKINNPTDAINSALKAFEGKDAVGIFASGTLWRGFANSSGQRNWFETSSVQIDWSFYLRDDKAVKTVYSDKSWNQESFDKKVQTSLEDLEILSKPPKTVSPGEYPVFLSPHAFAEIVGMMNWNGFGLSAHETKTTPFLKLSQGTETLHASVSISENIGAGIAANFNTDGFLKPDRTVLIAEGRYKDCLASPRSAKEFGKPTNGADASEFATSIYMNGGDLDESDILSTLNTGVYINNLWYLNFSDRSSFRMTGMTRFATFWVENGVKSAPLNVMRFDETAYRVLGKNLIGLTKKPELMLSTDTYFQRAAECTCLPGVMVKDFKFTM